MNTPDAIDYAQWIPLFPLPNAVLMPQAILPLHVFESRYRTMTRDALIGPRLIALCLLKPGHEPKYHTLHAEIHPAACVGTILREERLDDGRYNILLQGTARVRIVQEDVSLEYRRARLEPLATTWLNPVEESTLRGKLRQLLKTPPLAEVAAKLHWLDLLRCPDLSLSGLIDVLSAAALPTVEQKQASLAEPRVCARACCLFSALESLAFQIQPRGTQPGGGCTWPRKACSN